MNMKEPQPNFHRVATNNARAAAEPVLASTQLQMAVATVCGASVE